MTQEQARLFGETALERGFVTREQLDAALAKRRERDGAPLGAIMVSMGLITLPQATAIEKLNAVLRRQKQVAEGDEVDITGMTLGGCMVLEKLATGSMGTTYRAHHMRLDRDVVVKVLHPRMVAIEGNLERFAREARAAALLEHPAIVSVYDFDSDQGYHFIVMQYVRGQDLRQVLEGRGALGPRRALWIGARVLEGLAHAHAHQIIHRDIKPANLLITPEPRIKIADFGLVRLLSLSTSEEISVFGEIIGTPQYMSPEQAMGDDFDHRADLYSLGITLWELVAGRPPFAGNSTMEVLEKHIMEPLPSLAELAPGVGAELEEFFQKLCAKKQDDRFASAHAALAELQSMRFTTTGQTRRLGAMQQTPLDPSRSGDSPAIVTEEALNELKDRLRTSESLIAFEGDQVEPVEDDSDVAAVPEADAEDANDAIDASFSGMEVTSDAFADARRRLAEAQKDPGTQVPQLLLSLIKEGRNDALLSLEKELDRTLPTNPAVAFFLGRAYDNKGELESARAKFALATVLAPDHLQARLHLARALVALSRIDEAVSTLREATTWHPTSVKAVVSLAEVLYVVKNDREAAVPVYERAIELAPTRWQLRQQLAWILFELQQYEQAESVLKEVVQWKQDSAPAKKLLKQIRRKRKRLKKTREVAPESKPESEAEAPPEDDVGATTLAYMKRIRLAAASGKWERALSDAEAGLKTKPKSVKLLLAKAEALLKLGKASDAVAAFGQALAIDPDNEQAHEGLMETQALRRKTRRLKKKKE